MIYSLRGKLIETAENTVVVECAGVGYLCSTTRTTLNSLPQKGTEVMLYTYMNVREGAVDLFGFSTLSEKNCFCRLTSVSGVGPKVALAILSELKPDQLMLALVSQDVKSLTRAAGVGKKLAERILLELRDKVKNEELSEQLQQVSQVADQLSDGSGNVAEAVSALVVLGYSQSEAARAIAGQPPETSVQELINLTENLDCFDYLPGVRSDYDLGYYWIEESGCYDTSNLGALANYIDYESFGRDIRYEEGGVFGDNGYVRSNGGRFVDIYDGDIESIPEEYRISSPVVMERTEVKRQTEQPER